MHETALMRNLLEIVDRSAAGGGGEPVRVVHLRIGAFSGVSVEALRFAFDVLSPGTAASGGRLECERVPLRVRCRACGETAEPRDFVFICGACGSPDLDILGGREMEVDYILVGGEDGPDRSDVPEEPRDA